MTPKWTIRKYAVSSLGDEVALPWMLFEPGVSPPKTFHEAYWAACSREETFDEALAYVDSRTRKTRTVEVELPKVEDCHTITSEEMDDLTVISFPSYTHLSTDYGDCQMDIGHEELKPLGEYLLSLHYEKEQQ